MKVDLHTHTWPASSCSSISHDEYIEACLRVGVEAIALTNHGNIRDNPQLAPRLAAAGITLLHGVEISTLFGDFVVFSPSLGFLEGLQPVQEPLSPDEVPEDAAVVWVHPAAGGGMSGSAYFSGLEAHVAAGIHAVEVLNGNWLDRRYVEDAERIARALGLPGTGGSDAHQAHRIMACYTEIEGPVAGTADLVAALRAGDARPGREARRTARFWNRGL